MMALDPEGTGCIMPRHTTQTTPFTTLHKPCQGVELLWSTLRYCGLGRFI